MKNLYPIFLFSLFTWTLFYPAKSQSLRSKSDILLILDRNSLYENNADTVLFFIQELVQKHGRSVRVFEQAKGFSQNLDFSNFRLLIAVGEKSLSRLSSENQDKLKTYILGMEGQEQTGFLGIFFQEDRNEPSHPWDWYKELKGELEERRIDKEDFSLEFSASLEDTSYRAKPMAYQHVFPALMPESKASGTRLLLSYMAGRQAAFSHKTIGKLRNRLLQKHLEEAFVWIEDQRGGLFEKARILSLKLEAYRNKVLFNWRDSTYSNEGEYLLQKSKDGISWDIIHTRSATNTPAKEGIYQYLDDAVEAGDHVFRLLKKEKGRADMYSEPVLLSVSRATPEIELFPNPVQDILFVNISFDKAQETTISIRNSFLANPVWQSTYSHGASFLRLPVSVSALRPGLYHVCVKTHNTRIWKTFIKYD